MLEPAIDIVSQADILVIIGTSLNVYPAAGLIRYTRPGTTIYYIDPAPAPVDPGIKVLRMDRHGGNGRTDPHTDRSRQGLIYNRKHKTPAASSALNRMLSPC